MGRRRLFSTRRRSLFPRRRASGGDAALGILVLAGIAIAALGVYLIAVGAVALIGWLAAIAARNKAASTAHLVPVSSAATARPPQQLYHSVLEVDQSTFDDASRLEDTAKLVFARWASQLPKAPTDATDTIRSLSLRRRLIGRLTTKLDGKRFAWRRAPYRGRDRMVGATPIDP